MSGSSATRVAGLQQVRVANFPAQPSIAPTRHWRDTPMQARMLATAHAIAQLPGGLRFFSDNLRQDVLIVTLSSQYLVVPQLGRYYTLTLAADSSPGHTRATMLAAHYADIRLLHIVCVALSGTLFTCRGLLHLLDSPIANTKAVRWTSYVIDSVLLSAAILLTLILRQYPLVNAWLTMKTALLVLYIGLGVVALKRARTRFGRIVALIAALITYCSIIGVAVTHRASGWFSLTHP